MIHYHSDIQTEYLKSFLFFQFIIYFTQFWSIYFIIYKITMVLKRSLMTLNGPRRLHDATDLRTTSAGRCVRIGIDDKPNLTTTTPSLRRNNSKAIDSRILPPTTYLNVSNRFWIFRRPSLAPPDPYKFQKSVDFAMFKDPVGPNWVSEKSKNGWKHLKTL